MDRADLSSAIIHHSGEAGAGGGGLGGGGARTADAGPGHAGAAGPTRVQQVGRVILGQLIERVAAGHGQMLPHPVRCAACGGRLKRQERPRHLMGRVGDDALRRRYAWCVACGQSQVPLDEALGLGPGTVSPGLTRVVARATVDAPCAAAVQQVRETLGLGAPLSDETARRLTEQIGAVAAAQTQAAIARVQQGQPVWAADEGQETGDTTILAVEVDGVLVHQEDGWHEMKVVTLAPLGPALHTDPDSGRTSLAWAPACYGVGTAEAEAFWWRVSGAARRRGGTSRRGHASPLRAAAVCGPARHAAAQAHARSASAAPAPLRVGNFLVAHPAGDICLFGFPLLCYNRSRDWPCPLPKRVPSGDNTTIMATEHPLSMGPTDNYVTISEEPTIVLPAVRRKRRWLRILLLVVLLLIVAVAAAGIAAYADPPLLAPVGSILLGNQPGAVAWNGTDPINILVMGIDQRTSETPHSDTMIVVHVDPATHDVKMLSVPRDLWVNIPGYNYYKINAAYSNGYNSVVAAQGVQSALVVGAQLAQFEVQYALHIPINYFAVLKFSGFKSVVDALGGVTVCVPHEINDPTYPADVGNGYNPIDIKAGCQKMNGTVALEYARERHVDVQQDLGRIQQQQALLDGVEKQMLSPGTLFRLPAILSSVNGAVVTDLPRGGLPELGLLLGRAKGQHTQHAYINADGGYVTDTMLGGQDVLIGNWPKIGALVTSMFVDPALRSENASVQVRNGQHAAGLAALYTTILQGMGFNTVAPRDADQNTYVRNLVIVNQDRPGADYTVRKLSQMLQADVAYRHLGADHPQIVAILGSNAAEGQ